MVSARSDRLPGRIYEMHVICWGFKQAIPSLELYYYINCLVLASLTQVHNKNPFTACIPLLSLQIVHRPELYVEQCS